ncbi:MAG TPA: asparaginase domain-containing protein [Bacteroidales bacterium]|nr:asparaginase domain-containing protein [Bacteroidales bacterium]HPS45816.1 asparaginase domain-containing protein [Bacteroidales bacterium]HQH17997.1 asparaginase domain-containing protein [Bacteroidales bacterium]HQI44733.1 asparaginase domain-containing protein [Bacteroidales bacterium]
MDILFIQTGGTIDKDYPRFVKGYAFEISESAVERIIKKINPLFRYQIISYIKKDSLDITIKDRKGLLDLCQQEKIKKIIITHGTDTMIETAKSLQKIKNKTIILTGAFLPEKFKDSDAEFNLGCAIGAICHASEGVYIAMNGIVERVENVKRNLKTGQFICK